MGTCPCEWTRYGACVLAWCAYTALYAHVFFGAHFDVMLGGARRGDITPWFAIWAAFVVLGLYWLLEGIRVAVSHHDDFRAGSFLWSLGVIGLGLYAMHNSYYWYLDGSVIGFHVSRAFWLGWMASNVVNVWLQLRGFGGRRGDRAGDRREPTPFFRHRRSVTTEWVEEFEGRGVEALRDHIVLAGRRSAPPLPRPVSLFPSLIEQDRGATPALAALQRGEPQIVKTKDSAFVPVELLPADEAVPDNRRLARPVRRDPGENR